MTSNAPERIGTLGTADGKGVVRMEDRFATDIDDLWSALTQPPRLARWLGEVDGDLRLGGAFTAHFFASGWVGTGRVEACEPGRRLLVRTEDSEAREEHTIEATLTADGDQTILVIEERGMPVEHVAGTAPASRTTWRTWPPISRGATAFTRPGGTSSCPPTGTSRRVSASRRSPRRPADGRRE